MLWNVDHTHLALLGGVHILDTENPPLSDAAWRAFNGAPRIVFEHDFTETPDLSFTRLPPGQSLPTVIPPALFAAVQKRCRELQLNVDSFASSRPWFVAVSLQTHIAMRAGFRHDSGVDRTLWEQARQHGKAIEFLEETAAALRPFSAASMEEQPTMLGFATGDLDAEVAYVMRLVDGWKRHRADIVMASVQERVALMPALFRSLIENRNRNWLPRLLALAEEEHQTLAVVGALHTVGPVGIPALLRAAGHGVTAVDVSGE